MVLLDITTVLQPHKTNFSPLREAMRLNTCTKQVSCGNLASSKGKMMLLFMSLSSLGLA